MPQALGPGIFCHSPCFNRRIRNSADVVCVLWGVGWELGILKVLLCVHLCVHSKIPMTDPWCWYIC